MIDCWASFLGFDDVLMDGSRLVLSRNAEGYDSICATMRHMSATLNFRSFATLASVVTGM